MKLVATETQPQLTLPVLGLGTYHLLDRVSEKDAEQAILGAYEAGVRLVDTSDNYQNETVIGRAVAENELDDLMIATKTGLATSRKEFNEMRLQQRSANASPERLQRQLGSSLRNLGRSTIDIYQIHLYDPYTPEIDIAEAMNRFIDAGSIVHWGVSNYSATQLQKLLEVCDAHQLIRPSTVQPEMSLFSPPETEKISKTARDAGMLILAHSPLMKGLLADSMVDTVGALLEDDSDSVMNPAARPLVEAVHRRMESVSNFANGHGYSLSEFALAWLAKQPQTVVLNACVHDEQRVSSVKAVDWDIPAEGMALAEAIRQDSDALYGARALMLAVAETKPYYAKQRA